LLHLREGDRPDSLPHLELWGELHAILTHQPSLKAQAMLTIANFAKRSSTIDWKSSHFPTSQTDSSICVFPSYKLDGGCSTSGYL
mgnify:CR=1